MRFLLLSCLYHAICMWGVVICEASRILRREIRRLRVRKLRCRPRFTHARDIDKNSQRVFHDIWLQGHEAVSHLVLCNLQQRSTFPANMRYLCSIYVLHA